MSKILFIISSFFVVSCFAHEFKCTKKDKKLISSLPEPPKKNSPKPEKKKAPAECLKNVSNEDSLLGEYDKSCWQDIKEYKTPEECLKHVSNEDLLSGEYKKICYPHLIKKEEKDNTLKEKIKEKKSQLSVEKQRKNKWHYRTKIDPILRKEECGDCKNLCHYDKDDSGGLTCRGVSQNNNKEWFVNELNAYHKSCKQHPGGTYSLCKSESLMLAAQKVFWDKYVKPFAACDPKPFAMIADSSILEGTGTAIKHLQKMGNIKVDFAIGPKTLSLCTEDNFDAEKFTQLRIERFKTLRRCWKFCNGWINRAKRKLKEYKEGYQ